jgi:hypothetical protein
MVEASAAIDALLREHKRIAPDEQAKFDVVDVVQFMQLPRRFDRATYRVKTFVRSHNPNARHRSTLRECGSGFVGPQRIMEE